MERWNEFIYLIVIFSFPTYVTATVTNETLVEWFVHYLSKRVPTFCNCQLLMLIIVAKMDNLWKMKTF